MSRGVLSRFVIMPFLAFTLANIWRRQEQGPTPKEQTENALPEL